MKKFDLRITFRLFILFVLGLVGSAANSQNVKVQFIHNSADPLLDTVDIYVGGTKFENMPFRKASSLMRLFPQAYVISVNNKTSTDTANQRIFKTNVSFTPGSSNIIMLSGVVNTINFAPNPDNKNTALRVIQKTVPSFSSSKGFCNLNFMQAVTDAPPMNIFEAPSTMLYSAVKYTDNSALTLTTAKVKCLDFKDLTGKVFNKSIILDNIASYDSSFLTVFTSGFMDPVSNSNGKAWDVYSVDTAGNVRLLPGAARVQVIHNSTDTNYKNVDVWVNNNKIAANLAYHGTIPIVSIPRGASIVTVSPAGSPDTTAALSIFKSKPFTFTSNVKYVAFITGTKDTTGLPLNPEGIDRTLGITITAGYNDIPVDTSVLEYVFYNGTPDAGKLDVKRLAPLPSTVLFNKVSYNTAVMTFSSNKTDVLLNVINDNNNNVIGSYRLPVAGNTGKSAVLFTSGYFANPAGLDSFRVFVAFSDGMIIEIPKMSSNQRTSVQFINNSVDPNVNGADIWFNDVKVAPALGFAKSTPLFDFFAGMYKVTITAANSTDTSMNVLYRIDSLQQLDMNGKYLMVLNGVIDPNSFAPNPSGKNVSLHINRFDQYKSKSDSTNSFACAFVNGTPDINGLDMISVSPAASNGKLFDDVHYDDSITYANLKVAADRIINITNTDSSFIIGSFRLPVAARIGKAGVLFSTGVISLTANPTAIADFRLFLTDTTGTVVELKKLVSGIQLINNSVDITLDSIDVYVQQLNSGVSQLIKIGFRKATAFLPFGAFNPVTISIAPKHSASIGDKFYTQTLALDSGALYYAVADGVRDTAHSPDNPNPALDLTFKLYTFKGAKVTSTLPKNVDLLFHHGSTDLMPTTMLGYNGVGFISKNDAYGSFHSPYAYNPALDNLEFELKDAAADTVLLQKVVGNISGRKGQAGLLFTSGLYTNLLKLQNAKDTATHIVVSASDSNRVLGMFIAWPDGKIDTIQTVVKRTGITELSAATGEFNANFYPNPASDQLNITFELMSAGQAGIELFDMNGRLVTVVKQAMKPSGKNEISIGLNELGNGMYFCALNINGQKVIRKISVMK